MNIEDKKRNNVKEEESIPAEHKEILRTNKKRKNQVKREEEERLLEEMLEDLDEDTYAIMKKFK